MKKQLLTLTLLGFCALPVCAQTNLKAYATPGDTAPPAAKLPSIDDIVGTAIQRGLDSNAETSRQEVAISSDVAKTDEWVKGLLDQIAVINNRGSGRADREDFNQIIQTRMTGMLIRQNARTIEQNEQIIALLKQLAKK